MKKLFTSVLLLAAAGWVFFLIAPELVLLVEGLKFRNDVVSLRRLVRNPKHLEECSSFGSGREFPISGYQLRFENDSDYVIEAVCANESRKTVVVEANSLGFGVEREPGSSGILVKRVQQPDEVDDSYAVLKFKESRRVVGFVEGDLVNRRYKKGDSRQALILPDNTCQGWGYVCCDAGTVGSGDSHNRQVLDCRGECFSRCKSAPLVIVFGTFPALDENRTVLVNSDFSEIDFSWTTQDLDGEIERVRIEFGDGQLHDTDMAEGTVTHSYSCELDRCSYQASIRIEDNDGLVSGETRNAVLSVVVE